MAATSSGIMEGTLNKWTNVMQGWQYRWFILDDNGGYLSYYTTKDKMMRGSRRGCIVLRGAVIGIDDNDDSLFTITVQGKTFHLQAQDSKERERWLHVLDSTIQKHSQGCRSMWDPSRLVYTVQDIDKKLRETDAYLQLIIEQIQKLDVAINKCESEDDKSGYISVRDRANEVSKSIKHSIVMLQLAKNTAHPINGIYRPPPAPPRLIHEDGDVGRIQESIAESDSPLDAPVESGIEPALECKESPSKVNLVNKTLSSKAGAVLHPHIPPPLVSAFIEPVNLPETSYSTSDEEDFFDADDFDENQPYPPVCPSSRQSIEGMQAPTTAPAVHPGPADLVPRSSNNSTTESIIIAPNTVRGAANVRYLENGDLDFDALYDDDDEEDLGSLEGQGGVISHLLSQVKLGMDLTKVVLPTFILERRSLLEMFADFFAHPDLFVSIADGQTPEERMVAVIRWYLSSFHAGRRSSIAKKPYNPIIGEIFQCYWDIPPDTSIENKDCDSSGPVPWCKKSNLCFLAEQVSHHPPISAFYAEHHDKRITLSSHIWTKSKFLGLSIGVHMIGDGIIYLLDHNEKYSVTFPNGYGRSILTVPWVELGGSTSVTCEQTGYRADIEFHTKPFYGGKKNRISAELFQPNEKKSFLSISGEWNGSMQAKWADGRTETFLDTTSIPIISKNVRQISVQEPMESRRLWKEVTAGLALKDIERATEAKMALESKQRNEAKERKEKNLTFPNEYFHANGDKWIYIQPLERRLAEKREQHTGV